MLFGLESTFNFVQKLVTWSFWSVGEDRFESILTFGLRLLLVILVALLQVLLGSGMKVLEFFLVNLLKKRSGEQSHLIASVFTQLGLLLLAIDVQKFMRVALRHH